MAKNTNYNFSGEKNGNCKISDTEVLKIRRLYAAGNYTMRSLAEKYGVSHSQIRRIVIGLQR